MPRVITAGETMIVLSPPEGARLLHTGSLRMRVGGSESNVAIGVARLGIPSGWVSRLSADDLGDLVRNRIRAEGVDTSAVTRGDEPTGVYLREAVPAGTRVYYYRAGSAASHLAPGAFDPSYLDGADILHLSAITPALSATARAFTLWAADEAAKRGVRLSFDCNFRSRLWGAPEARAFIESFLPRAQIVFASEDDARALWGDLPDRELLTCVSGAGRDTILTLGARGCIATIGGVTMQADGVPIDPVDHIGSGDAFAAGYLASVVWGEEPARRLEIANALGAYNALSSGDYEGLPNKAELFAFMGGKRGVTLR